MLDFVVATRRALEAEAWERARVLLALAMRVELNSEEMRLRVAFAASGTPPEKPNLLRSVVSVWKELAPAAQLEACGVARLASRRYAFDTPASDAAAPEPPPRRGKKKGRRRS